MVFVGGDKVGDLKRGETAELSIRPGDHVVWISIDFERSRQLSVALADGGLAEHAAGVSQLWSSQSSGSRPSMGSTGGRPRSTRQMLKAAVDAASQASPNT